MLLALPMGVFAQNLKFGHINAQEIITVMPEFTKAQNDIQTLEKQLTAELLRKANLLPFAKCYTVVPMLFLKNAPKDGIRNAVLPENIVELMK